MTQTRLALCFTTWLDGKAKSKTKQESPRDPTNVSVSRLCPRLPSPCRENDRRFQATRTGSLVSSVTKWPLLANFQDSKSFFYRRGGRIAKTRD